MKTVTLQVKGMSCQHCVHSVEGALKQIGAVGRVDLANHIVEVSFEDEQLGVDSIKEAIEEQGYDVV